MNRRTWSRNALAIPPCAVLVPSFDDGTPEAAEEVRTFLEAHQGQPVLICRRVNGSIKKGN